MKRHSRCQLFRCYSRDEWLAESIEASEYFQSIAKWFFSHAAAEAISFMSSTSPAMKRSLYFFFKFILITKMFCSFLKDNFFGFSALSLYIMWYLDSQISRKWGIIRDIFHITRSRASALPSLIQFATNCKSNFLYVMVKGFEWKTALLFTHRYLWTVLLCQIRICAWGLKHLLGSNESKNSSRHEWRDILVNNESLCKKYLTVSLEGPLGESM